MAKSWCKVSAALDSHPRIRRAGNLGRQVFEFALRRNAELDKNGAIPAEHLEPEYLADVLMFSREDAVTGLSACVRTRLLASDGDQYVICGWDDEWGKRAMTEAERKRVSRAKARKPSDVTICPDTIVTESDGPECHRSEEIRSEEKRSDQDPPKAPQGGAVGLPGIPVSEGPKRKKRSARPKVDASPAELASVRVILDRLGTVAGVAYRGCDDHVALIVAQLRNGVTEFELRAVVAFCADQWSEKPEMRKYLRPETLFGPSTISRYLDPARAAYADEIARASAQPRLEVVR